MNFTPVDNQGRVDGFCLVKTVEQKTSSKGDFYLDKAPETIEKIKNLFAKKEPETALDDEELENEIEELEKELEEKAAEEQAKEDKKAAKKAAKKAK